MRQPINSDKRHKFIELVGSGLDPYEAYPLAGYATSGTESGWKANCRSLCARLRSEIDAARAANNLPESRKRQTGDLSIEESDELLSLTRENLQRAREQNNVGAVTKLLRQVERLTRRSARGRPASAAASTVSAKPARVNRFAHLSSDEVFAIARSVLSEEENAAIDAEYPAHVETERQLWLQGMPNRYWEIAYGRKLPKPEEEPSPRTELNTSASVAAIETVTRP